MAIIKITNFGGEIPRMSARALPAEAAQVNSNLLATSSEFRPLLGDSVVGVVPAGTQTLHRLIRDALGALRTDAAAGWIAEVADKNYVKGQINDDATERTYVSFNDGSAPPRVIDAKGANRQLGVPAPSALGATVNQGKFFNKEKLDLFLTDTLNPALLSAAKSALMESDPGARMYPGATETVAGSLTLHGLDWWDGVTPNDYHNLRYTVPLTVGTAAGLADPRITPQTAGATLVIRISCVPLWGRVGDVAPFKTALRALKNPMFPTAQLLSDALIDATAAELVTQFDPRGASLKSQREALDSTVAAFKRALGFVLTPNVAVPTAPVKPATAEYTSVNDGGPEGGNTSLVRTAPWIAYDAALVAYNAALATQKAGATTNTNEKSGRIAEIVVLQAQARRITQELEAAYLERRAGLGAWIDAKLSGRDGNYSQDQEVVSNIVKVDADPMVDARFYFATHTTDWGEESAPSPVTAMQEVDQYSDVTLTLPAPPAGRNVVTTTLYRSNVGTVSTGFQFVAAIPVATSSYTDKLKGAQLGEICPTLTWLEPPAKLRGLVGMPNGVMAGFVDNFVAFCDPHHPYAWPVEYQIALKFPVVGLGVFGQSLVVGTYANPSILRGSDSASMSEDLLDDAQACLSARSMVSTGGGVLYASPDGICFASQNGVEVITTGLFAREDWQALHPESIVAVMHEGVYYFWFAGTGALRPAGCYALDTAAKKLTQVDMTATAVFADSLTDAVFYTSGGSLKRAFSTGRRVGKWRSGKLVLPAQTPFAWLQVDGDQSVLTPATVRWYGDGVLRHTATVTGLAPTRLPAGRWLEHEIEIESASRLTKVMLAGHTLELQAA